MKKVFYLFLILFLNSVIAQVKIGDNPLVISSSSILELESSSKGFLPPRMSKTQQDAITSPAVGLQIWCTSCGLAGELHVYAGTSAGWINIGPPTVSVGDNYGGGKLAYILVSGDPGYDPNVAHGLIAAVADYTQQNWDNFTGAITTGATATGLGQGLANTNAIYSAHGGTSYGFYAARSAKEYAGGGYTDWYLPTKDELYKLYLNRVVIGGFDLASGWYWSSSETSLTNVWKSCFFEPNLVQQDGPKTGNLSARFVRKF